MPHPRSTAHEPVIERETALVKIHASTASRAAVGTLACAFGAKVVDAGDSALMLELTATPAQVERFIERVRPFGVTELTRTGRIAMVRGMPVHRVASHRSAHRAELASDPFLTLVSFRSQADGAA